MKTKICRLCGIEKELTIENFSPRLKGSKDGFRNECKECKGKYNKQYFKENKENIAENQKQYRDKNKEIISEKKKQYNQKNKLRISEHRKSYYQNNKSFFEQYYQNNKEEILKSKKGYYKENKVKISEYKKQWYGNNKKINSERNKKWRSENKKRISIRMKKWIDRNKVALSEYNKIWRKNNPNKTKFYNHKRRSLENELLCDFSSEQWDKCKEYFNNKCAYCGKELPLAQEHFIPVSKGGEYTANNIIPACISCNSSKNNKDFFEWYPKQKFYLKTRKNKILKYLKIKVGD